MSAEVVRAVEGSFKALVAEKPYKSITVKEICEGAFISRRTFYANFTDKRAVISHLFIRDAIRPAACALDLFERDELDKMAPVVTTRFYCGIYDNRDFYMALVRPMVGVDPTFSLAVARNMYNALKTFVLKRNPGLGDEALKVLYYHAAGWALFLEKWIYDGCEESPEKLGTMQADIIVPSLKMLMG